MGGRVAIGAALLLAGSDAAAQLVHGAVRNESTGVPVPGAIVVLVATDGVRAAGALSDEAGRYRLTAPSAGSFHVRVDIVGYQSVSIPAFRIGIADTLARDVAFRFERVALPRIAVTASSRCTALAGDDGEAPRLWAEARKTLEAASLAVRDARFSVSLRRYARTIGLPDSVIRASRTWTQQGVSSGPFESLPPEVVAQEGFATGRDSSRYYHAPDAAVLLSDAFVVGHCFGTRRDGPAGTVGLSFRPQQASRKVDIEGVLWLDSTTAELRSLEYRYVPAVGRPPVGGGFVAFGRYPNGLWGVHRWAIRLPMLRVLESRRRPDGALGRFVDTVVTAMREEGGELVPPAAALSGARLSGAIVDSTRGAPLAGASVLLEGLGLRAETDQVGRFVFEGVEDEGEVRVRASHPRLDSIGLPALYGTVRVRRGAESIARLGVPGVQALARARCPPAARDARRVVLGVVQDDSAGTGLDADVVLLERRPGTGGRDSLVRHATATNDAGRFVVCGAHPGSPAWVAVRRLGGPWEEPRPAGGDSLETVTVIPIVPAAADSAPRVATRLARLAAAGSGAVVEGWILLPDEFGAPGAEVLVDDVARGRAATDGAFRVAGVPAGLRRITFRATGFLPVTVQLEAQDGAAEVLLVAPRLAPLVVVQPRAPLAVDPLAEFRQRRSTGGGYYLERRQIERLNPRTLTDLLRSVPGVRVIARGGGFAYTTTHFQRFPSPGGDVGTACDMMIYVDGQPFAIDGGDADSRIRVNEISGLEVYVSAASVPRRYAGTSSACGVILVWR